MFGLLVFAGVVIGLIAVTGRPYPQSWHGRWGNHDR
jgi:hypothetical protein